MFIRAVIALIGLWAAMAVAAVAVIIGLAIMAVHTVIYIIKELICYIINFFKYK